MRRWAAAPILAGLLLSGLLLAGCGERARVAATAPPRPAAPAAQAPVNPDPGVIRYACAGGETVTAGYPDHETAVVTYKDHAYTLNRVRSADGARYTGYGLQWWVRGDRASLAELEAGQETARGPGVECRPAPAASESTVRTGFTPTDRRSLLNHLRLGV